MGNIILPQIQQTDFINDNANLMIEQDGSIQRYSNSKYFNIITDTIESIAEEKFNVIETKLLNLTSKVEEALADLTLIKLNYAILAYENSSDLLKDSPNENTIGIITNLPISTWQLGGDIPTNPIEGMVWIETGTSQTAGSFASLKLNDNTFSPVNPLIAYQYENFDWVVKDAMIYIDSTWKNFNMIPVFTYTGKCEIVNDDDENITTSLDNWKIRFLTSGILTFHSLNGAKNGIDVFLVGGGGGGCSYSSSYYGPGGGGGYTTTDTYKTLDVNNAYEIVIGAGGIGSIANSTTAPATNGTASTAFSFIAEGGTAPNTNRQVAGSGGSAGSPMVGTGAPRDGFSDGAGNSEVGLNSSWLAGKGQGTTTREFGEATNNLYSTGGAAKSVIGINAKPNTGDGGSGSSDGIAGNGGSGIIVIRNARGALVQ